MKQRVEFYSDTVYRQIRRFHLAMVVLLCCSVLPASSYLTGGSTPLPPESQAILDKHADLISLRINTEWMEMAGIDPIPYVEAIALVAEAVEEGVIPGAVLHVGRLASTEMMPIAVGYKIVDPEKRPVGYDTRYYVEDLTAPLTAIPLLLAHCQERGLPLETRIETIFPAWNAEDRREVTIESVLRHSTGFPASWEDPATLPTSRRMLVAWMNDLELAAEPDTKVIPSRLNHLLAGLILEEVKAKQLKDIIDEEIITRFQLPTAQMGIISQERAQLAPGRFSERWDRFLWGETDEPIVQALGLDSAWAGLVINADEVAAIAGGLLLLSLSAPEDVEVKNLPALYQAFRTDPSITGGERMGLGYEIGRFTPKSFGWNSVAGPGFWVLPEHQALVVFLSNMDHVSGRSEEQQELRAKVLELLVRAAEQDAPAEVDANLTDEELEQDTDGNH
ncbi:MAG: beta-lactamase family protein [Candidatus Sumerlaeia bacterium]|nr:beta-lactamase family protein [Candidatus Sumerlaeia bacterium]